MALSEVLLRSYVNGVWRMRLDGTIRVTTSLAAPSFDSASLVTGAPVDAISILRGVAVSEPP